MIFPSDFRGDSDQKHFIDKQLYSATYSPDDNTNCSCCW